MKFNTPERENYIPQEPQDSFNAMQPETYGMKVDNGPDIGLGVDQIGMSVPLGIAAQNVSGIYSKIRMGAGKLELQFPGYKSGQRNSQSPEMYGEDQRQALREMQMANNVSFTTHATWAIMGMLGRDERGNFSVNGANHDLSEVKRAMDFQADVSGGGSVVVHSGEFDRPMTDMYIDDDSYTNNLSRDPTGRLLVKQYHTQETDAQFILMDKRTSQKYETVQKDRLVAAPKWLRHEGEDRQFEDTEGNKVIIKEGDYIDYQGRKIPDKDRYDPIRGRVPEYNAEESRFEIRMKHFDDYVKEARERNENFEKVHGRKPELHEKIFPEEAYMQATMDMNEGYSRGWALQFSQAMDGHLENIEALEKAIGFYKKLDDSIPEDEKWKLTIQKRLGLRDEAVALLPQKTQSPLKALQEALDSEKKQLQYSRQSAASQEAQARDTAETKESIITPIKRLATHGVRMYAEAGLHAMRRSKDPDNPVTLAIENLFPERFGGHLEELKWLIQKSRDRMVEMLTTPTIEDGFSRKPTEKLGMKRSESNDPDENNELTRRDQQENPYYMAGISHEQAEELAKKHIRATLDTGHLNMWRKFWQEDPKMTPEQNDAKFKEWYLEQVKSLAEADMIGNVHLADNFGYQDDHTAPGQGTAPIKEAVAILKKHGYDQAITVEPGADASTDQSDFHGLMKTWRLFGGDIYGMGGGGGSHQQQQWTNVQNSYFGQAQAPYFVFGGYSPSQDWTLWSSVPME